ncbi:MAG: S8 family serine peptidase, partial [Paracoccaceae bacterium]
MTLVSACQDSAEQSSFISNIPLEALTAFFVADFAALEAPAAVLRDTDPRYLAQQFEWSLGGSSTTFESYSLANARVEYAHAAGLTGSGQLIAIVDTGFRLDHDEFVGKSITLANAPYAPGVDDHGTSVASVAAGAANSGEIIGVAPGADLLLGSFDTLASMAAATQQAVTLGAIVQNNSWGYDLPATNSSFQSVFGGSSGTSYLNALKLLAQNAVIVFSASNNPAAASADIMTALPVLVP